jgi:hypothetical protein
MLAARQSSPNTMKRKGSRTSGASDRGSRWAGDGFDLLAVSDLGEVPMVGRGQGLGDADEAALDQQGMQMDGLPVSAGVEAGVGWKGAQGFQDADERLGRFKTPGIEFEEDQGRCVHAGERWAEDRGSALIGIKAYR